jgi:hypothetical protein
MTWMAHNFRNEARDVRHVQKATSIFGRCKTPPQNWSDRDAIKVALREHGVGWRKACAIALANSSSLRG